MDQNLSRYDLMGVAAMAWSPMGPGSRVPMMQSDSYGPDDDFKLLVTGGRNYGLVLVRPGQPSVDMDGVHKAHEEYQKMVSALDRIKRTHGMGVHLYVGDATGADAMALNYAKRLGWTYTREEANWSVLGNRAGPERNRRLVQHKPNLCLAFHSNIKESKGTIGTINLCFDAGILVRLNGEEIDRGKLADLLRR